MSSTPGFYEAQDIRPGMWVILPGEKWPMEVTKISRSGPLWDNGDGVERRRVVRVWVGYLENTRYHEYSEDLTVPTY